MHDFPVRFIVSGEDQEEASRAAAALVDRLRETEGVVEVDRKKGNDATMDLGAIVIALAQSGAAVAIAQGLAAWLISRRSASVVIERTSGSESIKAVVSGINIEASERITEIIVAS